MIVGAADFRLPNRGFDNEICVGGVYVWSRSLKLYQAARRSARVRKSSARKQNARPSEGWKSRQLPGRPGQLISGFLRSRRTIDTSWLKQRCVKEGRLLCRLGKEPNPGRLRQALGMEDFCEKNLHRQLGVCRHRRSTADVICASRERRDRYPCHGSRYLANREDLLSSR